MNATFRCKRLIKYVGLGCTVVGVVFVGMLYLALNEDDPNAKPWAGFALAAISIGPILLLGLGGPYILAAAIRHRLTIDGDKVESVGVFATGRIDLALVAEARWRISRDGGRLTLIGPSGRLKIDFSDYPSDDSRRLIKFFRLRLPEAVQRGWDKYWSFTWPLFDVPDPARREEFAEKTRALRARLILWFVVGMMLVVAAGVVLWRYTGDATRTLGLPLFLLTIAIVPLLLVVRADNGKISEKTDPRRNITALPALPAAALVVFMLTFCLCTVFRIFDIPGIKALLFSGSVIGAVLAVIGARLSERRAKRARAEGAKLAEKEYMRRGEDL
jgi:hypothetical protein